MNYVKEKADEFKALQNKWKGKKVKLKFKTFGNDKMEYFTTYYNLEPIPAGSIGKVAYIEEQPELSVYYLIVRFGEDLYGQVNPNMVELVE